MAISGFNTSALPNALPTSLQLAGSNPLLAQQPSALLGTPLPSAQAGFVERPGVGTRLMNAMKAAVGELRSPGAPATTQLAMHSPVPAEPAAATLTKKVVRAKNVKSAKTWKTLANPPQQAVTAPVANQAVAGSALPGNATQLPGATVYSYDGNGNPAVAGLQGLDPQMQAQLGMTPTMLQGINGMARAVDPEGPQVNATNQTNVGGLGAGMGMGVGTAMPVLGQPILNVTSPGDTAPAPPHAGSGTGGNQVVSNTNSTDIANRNQGMGGYGYGSPWDASGGIASPYSPYGSSMTGAYALGNTYAQRGGVGGFFSRLLGS